MTTLHHHLTLTHAEAPMLQREQNLAPVLAYDAQTAPEAALLKTLAGFGLGSVLMGLMLNAAAFMVFNRMAHLWADKFDFVIRCTLMLGLTFVGASLLLVSLKAREDKSPVPLHSRHWLASLLTGALFALAVFGPGLVAERGLDLNSWTSVAVWMGVLVVPILSSFWLVTRQRTRAVLDMP